MTRSSILIATALILAEIALATPALARGGGPITTNSQGYQRRLVESRQQLPPPAASLAQPYTAPPAVYPRRPVKRQQKPRR